MMQAKRKKVAEWSREVEHQEEQSLVQDQQDWEPERRAQALEQEQSRTNGKTRPTIQGPWWGHWKKGAWGHRQERQWKQQGLKSQGWQNAVQHRQKVTWCDQATAQARESGLPWRVQQQQVLARRRKLEGPPPLEWEPKDQLQQQKVVQWKAWQWQKP